MYESPYIKRRKDKHPNPEHIHELKILRAMVRQEDRQGDIGWGGSWIIERYQRLKDKHPEAFMAFQAELRGEKEEKRLHQEAIRKHRYSPYIEEVEGWPDSFLKVYRGRIDEFWKSHHPP